MAQQTFHVNYIQTVLDEDNEIFYSFNLLDVMGFTPNTVQQVKYNFRIFNNPINETIWYPNVRLDTYGVGNHTYVGPSHHDSYWWAAAQVFYWPTNDDLTGYPEYNDPWKREDGLQGIVHIPQDESFYPNGNAVQIQFRISSHTTTPDDQARIELHSVEVTYDSEKLTWDESFNRRYDTGVDRGIYCDLTVPPIKPWNGLVSVKENLQEKVTPVYFDGQVIHEYVTYTDYEAQVESLSRPPDFLPYDGHFKLRPGVYLGGQAPRLFNFSWRSYEGDAVAGDDAHYKVHILYNVMAIPETHTASTESAQPDLVKYRWKFRSVPEEIGHGARRTSKLTFDSRRMNDTQWGYIEQILHENVYPFILPPDLYLGYA